MIFLLSLLLHSLSLAQCCFPSNDFNIPLSNGYSTMSFTFIFFFLCHCLNCFIISVRDPETGKVYQKIDDGSGNPQWIEENNMCQNKYIDGLGYVSVPSSCLMHIQLTFSRYCFGILLSLQHGGLVKVLEYLRNHQNVYFLLTTSLFSHFNYSC